MLVEEEGKISYMNEGDGLLFTAGKLDNLAVPTHQLGGEPWLIQPWESFEQYCPKCAAPMPFLAAIGNQCLLPQGFVDNNYVQICYSLCEACQIIGAKQLC